MTSAKTVTGQRLARPERDIWIAVLVVAGGLGLAWPAAPARASCVAQPAKIVWSYPADGDVDVPTNAHFFYKLTLSGQTLSAVELNGRALSNERGPEGPPYGRPLPLEPRTRYTLALRLDGLGDSAATTLRVRFTTGAGPVPADLPPALTIDRITPLSVRELSPVCREVWESMDCFDTGQDTHLVFETSARPLLFYVSPLSNGSSVPWTMTWPGICGDPELYVRGPSGCRGPHRIYAVAHTGEVVTTDVNCGGPPPPGPPPDAGTVPDVGAAAPPAPPGAGPGTPSAVPVPPSAAPGTPGAGPGTSPAGAGDRPPSPAAGCTVGARAAGPSPALALFLLLAGTRMFRRRARRNGRAAGRS